MPKLPKGTPNQSLLALRWIDAELLLCQISVTRSLHQLRDKSIVIRQPKTAKGRRMVALPPSAALVLSNYREDKEKLLSEIKAKNKDKNSTKDEECIKDEDLIFCQLDGKPLVPDLVSKAWTRLAEKLGIKNISLHDARRTHASLMLKQGIHPKIVQERLGNANISTTLDIYSHVAPGLQEAAAAMFDKGLSRANKQTANIS